MQQDAPDEGLDLRLSMRDLAQQLSVDPSTIKRWVSRGEMPAPIKVGGSLRWRSRELQSWVNGLPREYWS